MKPRSKISWRACRRSAAVALAVFGLAVPLALDARSGSKGPVGKPSKGTKLGAVANHGFNDNGAFLRSGRLAASTWTDARLAFSGRSLMYECSSTDRGFLGDVWSQSALLARFSGGSDFFQQAVRSAGEADWAGRYRPAGMPLLPGFTQRLGVGGRIDSPAAQGKVWLLNHVRFRRDQIKLNYELVVFEAGVDPTIEYAAFIHSVLIPPELQPAYRDAVMGLETDEERTRRITTGPDDVGCALRTLLDTWIPQGRYFFMHANVFDRLTGGDAGEWVFAEFKPARYQSLAGFERPEPMVFDSVPAGGVPGETLELRVVPMAFQRFRKSGPHLVPIAGDQVVIWKSSNVADAFIELVEDEDGFPVPRNDVVFNNPQAHTCVQCHDAAFGVALSDSETTLPPLPKNHFRHIAWGTIQPFGLPRLGGARPSAWYERFLQQRTELDAGRIVTTP
jgi:hypothetical protein